MPTFAPEPGNGVGDPVDVARRGVAHAREKHYDVVIVDTAGRLGVDAELMQQAADIRDATRPDETLFVIDAMIGQDAVATAEAFRDGVGFSGVVLTKLDGDARGGAALSVREVTGQPILFASNGEKLADFDVFHPDRMASRILGMGDLLTLIEQAELAFDEEQTAKAAAKISTGELSLEDFLEQMLAIRKMGPIGNILGMLPGANTGQMKDALAQVDDRQMDKLQAIIRGMTPAERADPKIINGSRRLRIANGSGVTVNDVNELVNRFFEARKMMKQMAGQFGFGGGARSATRKQAKARKGKKAKGGRPTPARGGALPAGMRGHARPVPAAAVAARAAAGAGPAAARLRPEPAQVPEGQVAGVLNGGRPARRRAAGRADRRAVGGRRRPAHRRADPGRRDPGRRRLDRARPGRRALPRRARPVRAGGPRRGRRAGPHRPRRRHPADPRLRLPGRHHAAAVPRRPAGDHPSRPAPGPAQALHPRARDRRRRPGAAARAGRRAGRGRRRLGEAGRRLDRPRRR